MTERNPNSVNLPERLRDPLRELVVGDPLLIEAANEIERLRAFVREVATAPALPTTRTWLKRRAKEVLSDG